MVRNVRLRCLKAGWLIGRSTELVPPARTVEKAVYKKNQTGYVKRKNEAGKRSEGKEKK